jgi:hypothetical protein
MSDPGDENDFKGVGTVPPKGTFFPVLVKGNQTQPKELTEIDTRKIPEGGAVKVRTRNSTYLLRKQAGGITWTLEQIETVKGGYKLEPNPCVVQLSHGDILMGRGLHLLRVRDGVVNMIITSTVQSIEEIK